MRIDMGVSEAFKDSYEYVYLFSRRLEARTATVLLMGG